MRLLVTRPEPDAGRQAADLVAAGHTVLIEAMLEIAFEDDKALDLQGVQGLIATSRNGLRALERIGVPAGALTGATALPLFAVGPASAQKAHALGFETVFEGSGDGKALGALIKRTAKPENGALLHLAGANLAGDLKGELEAAGFTVRQDVLYRAVPAKTLSAPVRQVIASGELDGVILMSPRTAKIYRQLIEDGDLTRQAARAVHFCLSPAVAQALGGPLAENAKISGGPHMDDLLALLARETAN